MIITKEFVDHVAPKHNRTSCSDENLQNRFCGWYGQYHRGTGQKDVKYPRCHRCYLLSHLGEDTDVMEFKIMSIEIIWGYKQKDK